MPWHSWVGFLFPESVGRKKPPFCYRPCLLSVYRLDTVAVSTWLRPPLLLMLLMLPRLLQLLRLLQPPPQSTTMTTSTTTWCHQPTQRTYDRLTTYLLSTIHDLLPNTYYLRPTTYYYTPPPRHTGTPAHHHHTTPPHTPDHQHPTRGPTTPNKGGRIFGTVVPYYTPTKKVADRPQPLPPPPPTPFLLPTACDLLLPTY